MSEKSPVTEQALADPNSGPKYVPYPVSQRRGIGLCLSGGGYRAALFHMGALRRLNEFGIFTSADFRSISSVSGGSITAAALAAALTTITRPAAGPIPNDVWNREFRDKLREFTKKDIRTGAVATRLLPWNWFCDSAGVEALAKTYERRLTSLKLTAMPATPDFIFCATDMAYGVNWVFERGRMGDYQAGYKVPPPTTYPLGRAVAASSCFPPVFNPLPARINPTELLGGKALPGAKRDACIRGLRLTDGGDYDNMGLEPVWKSHEYVLVSDAGGLFTDEGDKGLIWRIPRYQGIQERQSQALRRRWLISNFDLGEIKGTYWAVSGGVASYGFSTGYSEDLAKDVIAEIRTDLDAFSDAEAAVLENHGYLMADAAIQKYAVCLIRDSLPIQIPHPSWMDEKRVREALKESGKRRIFGRH